MSNDKKNIDLLFEEKLKGFKENPPPYTWDRLDRDLNKEKSVRLMFYFRWIAASVLILLAFGAGYFYATYTTMSDQDISQGKTEVQNTSEHLISGETGTMKPEKTLIPETNQPVAQHSVPAASFAKIDHQQSIKSADHQPHDQYVLKTENMIHQDSLNDNEMSKDLIVEGLFLNETNSTGTDAGIAVKQDKSWKSIDITELNPTSADPDAIVYGMDQSSKKDIKWLIGAQFAPVLSYRDISINYENQSGFNAKEAESQLNDAEEALLSYAGGIDLNYFLSNRWSIQSGVVYSKIGQVNNNALSFRQEDNQYLLFAIQTSTGKLNIMFEKIPDDIKKFDPPAKDTLSFIDLNDVKVIQNIELFEVPFMIKYNILNRKFGINISGGLSPAYLLNNNIVLQVDENKYDIGNSENLNSMIVNSSFSLGLNYRVSNKFRFNLEPNFKYSLSPINKNSQFDYHPYYLSVFTGIQYTF